MNAIKKLFQLLPAIPRVTWSAAGRRSQCLPAAGEIFLGCNESFSRFVI